MDLKTIQIVKKFTERFIISQRKDERIAAFLEIGSSRLPVDWRVTSEDSIHV